MTVLGAKFIQLSFGMFILLSEGALHSADSAKHIMENTKARIRLFTLRAVFKSMARAPNVPSRPVQKM